MVGETAGSRRLVGAVESSQTISGDPFDCGSYWTCRRIEEPRVNVYWIIPTPSTVGVVTVFKTSGDSIVAPGTGTSVPSGLSSEIHEVTVPEIVVLPGGRRS